MKTIQMNTAVLLALKSFGTDIFSIFNITKAIREDVNLGDYELVDYGRAVNHDDVKETFLELLDNVVGDIYEISDSGRGYREFRMTPTSTISLPNATPQTYGRTPTVVTPTPITAASAANSNIPFSDDVLTKIVAYVQDKGPVTMKQIQSRLKGYPYTCKDIADLLIKVDMVDKNSVSAYHSKIKTL